MNRHISRAETTAKTGLTNSAIAAATALFVAAALSRWVPDNHEIPASILARSYGADKQALSWVEQPEEGSAPRCPQYRP